MKQDRMCFYGLPINSKSRYPGVKGFKFANKGSVYKYVRKQSNRTFRHLNRVLCSRVVSNCDDSINFPHSKYERNHCGRIDNYALEDADLCIDYDYYAEYC